MVAFPRAILSADPGGNCGFAILKGPPSRKSSYTAWIVKLGPWPLKGDGEPPKDDALAVVKEFCQTYGEEGVVICERFTTGGRQNRYGRFTNELIGAIDGITYVYGTPLVPVMNRARKEYTPLAYKTLGVKVNPNHDPDDVAALAHLFAFVKKLQNRLESSTKPSPRRRGTATSKPKP